MLLTLIAVTAVLMALSSIGVQIGPLLAGAGVVGIAVGFGAQTLVRDIFAGVFYLLDDAFRVGEYIQSGNYKGTVEAFSLRSVKIRHHRGSLFTVPFGELGAVQNMSRDWVIDKLTVSVTYDTDLAKVKKVIKEVSKEIMAEPELAANIIEPLKMQGVEQFGEFAIQIRMKMMTKPGEQFVIRRRAYALIKQAFDANGIEFAFPTVTVAGGGEAALRSHSRRSSWCSRSPRVRRSRAAEHRSRRAGLIEERVAADRADLRCRGRIRRFVATGRRPGLGAGVPRPGTGAPTRCARLRPAHELGPRDVLGDAPCPAVESKPQSVPASTRRGSPTAAATRSRRSATTSGCSTKLVSVSITPATITGRRRGGSLPSTLNSWAWRALANGSTKPPTLAWRITGQIVCQRHVAVVRPLVVAPAHVHAHALARHVARAPG